MKSHQIWKLSSLSHPFHSPSFPPFFPLVIFQKIHSVGKSELCGCETIFSHYFPPSHLFHRTHWRCWVSHLKTLHCLSKTLTILNSENICYQWIGTRMCRAEIITLVFQVSQHWVGESWKRDKSILETGKVKVLLKQWVHLPVHWCILITSSASWELSSGFASLRSVHIGCSYLKGSPTLLGVCMSKLHPQGFLLWVLHLFQQAKRGVSAATDGTVLHMRCNHECPRISPALLVWFSELAFFFSPLLRKLDRIPKQDL